MSDNEMRIAVAEHLGWKVFHGGKYVQPKGERFRNLIVDPLEDLNAMAEAENSILDAPCTLENDMKKKLYRQNLTEICKNAGWRFAYQEFHATARQRAEAFLRCVGKWIEKGKE